jgi:hypothetical protein
MAAARRRRRRERPLAAALAPFTGPSLLLGDGLGREDAIFLSGTALWAASVGEVAVFALALVLLAALRERQSRRIAGQEALATQVCRRGAGGDTGHNRYGLPGILD